MPEIPYTTIISASRSEGNHQKLSLGSQEPKNQILSQNLHHHYDDPSPKYISIGHMDPLGFF